MKVFLPQKKINTGFYLSQRPHVVMVDNYDSFTYNVVQSLLGIGCRVTVFMNDEVEAGEILRCNPSAIVISPGPMDPTKSGISMDVIDRFASHLPIFGICLGFQCIVEQWGGKIGVLDEIKHGKTSMIYHDLHPLFDGFKNPFPAARYHSLGTYVLPHGLDPLAWSDLGIIMAAGNEGEKIVGVQFHPESFLTPRGERIFYNFLKAYSNA